MAPGEQVEDNAGALPLGPLPAAEYEEVQAALGRTRSHEAR